MSALTVAVRAVRGGRHEDLSAPAERAAEPTVAAELATARPLAQYWPAQPWRYWELCGGTPCPPLRRYGGGGAAAAAAEERFLLLETRGAGWNNERHSVELAFTLAYLWRRTLVLPPFLGPSIYPGDLWHANSSFDLGAMSQSVKVLSADGFLAYARAHPERFPGGAAAVAGLGLGSADAAGGIPWEEFPGWFVGTEGVALTVLADLNRTGRIAVARGTAAEAAVPEYQAFATALRAEQPLTLTAQERAATALRFHPHSLLGNFYTKVYIDDARQRRQVREAVRRSVRVRDVFFEAAEAAMLAAGISPGSFASMHNRQGDWEEAHWGRYLDPSKPELFTEAADNRRFLSRHGVLYVATNAVGEQRRLIDTVWFPAVRQLMPSPRRIVTLTGEVFAAARAVAGHVPGWAGLVEQIVCSQAGTFLGAWGSTFSGYIHRLRGYMPEVADKRILFVEAELVREGPWFPSWSVAQTTGEIDTGREWREAWEAEDAPPASGAVIAGDDIGAAPAGALRAEERWD